AGDGDVRAEHLREALLERLHVRTLRARQRAALDRVAEQCELLGAEGAPGRVLVGRQVERERLAQVCHAWLVSQSLSLGRCPTTAHVLRVRRTATERSRGHPENPPRLPAFQPSLRGLYRHVSGADEVTAEGAEARRGLARSGR